MIAARLPRVAARDRRALERLTLLAGTCAVTGFVVLRWLVAAHREISRFVVAGSDLVTRAQAPRYLYVFPHATGYDGQFYWRLAADPAQLHLTRDLGVRLDSAYRLNRILFPALVWVVSLGHAPWVALAMVLVNVAAVLALLVLGLRILRRVGRSPLWALCLMLVPGLVGSVSRDLTEALTCVLGLAGVIAIREHRVALAALSWSAAVLTRETMLAGVVVYAAVALVEITRRRRGFGRADLVWILPLVVFALWQLVVWADVGTVPIISSAGSGDIGAPLVGLVESVSSWFSPGGFHQMIKGSLYLVQTLSAVVLLALAWRNRRRVARVELAVVAAFVLLVVLETKQGWVAPFDGRYESVPMVGAWAQLVEVGDRRLLRQGVAVLAPVVAATLLWRVVVI